MCVITDHHHWPWIQGGQRSIDRLKRPNEWNREELRMAKMYPLFREIFLYDVVLRKGLPPTILLFFYYLSLNGLYENLRNQSLTSRETRT